MYDDASYYAFVPNAYVHNEKPLTVKHARKTSLLAQPTVSYPLCQQFSKIV